MSPDGKLNQLLRVILPHPEIHAGLLNTFSYLEYVGFSKIVKSQDVDKMNLVTLQHASEELRHAQLLKKLSMKVGGARYASYAPENLLCGAAARKYFENIDHTCDARLHTEPERARRCYLYVTWLVEVRALEVYGTYLKMQRELGGASALESLLREEDRHLHEVTDALSVEDPCFAERKLEFCEIEIHAYREFLQTLEATLVNRIPLGIHAV